MKKTIIILLFLINCYIKPVYSASFPMRELEVHPAGIGFDVYYNSSLFCSKDKPIKKISTSNMQNICLGQLNTIHYKYFKRNNEIICQIPENFYDGLYLKEYAEQLENYLKLEKDLEKEKMKIAQILSNKDMQYNLFAFFNNCYDEEEIYFSETFSPHEGACTEEELKFVKEDNEKIITYNETLEKELMENYDKDCFSCEDGVDFWTDEETCKLCPNREMNGNLCVKKKDKK